jgi:hypothetical protein
VIRHQQYKAEATGGAQGFFCGGSLIGHGFIDDGSGNGTYKGKAGRILTLTSLSGRLSPYTWLIGDNFPTVQALTTLPTNGQVPLDLATPIAAPPGNVTNAPFTNLQINGYVYAGNAGNVYY